MKAGRELDARVAQEVFGLNVMRTEWDAHEIYPDEGSRNSYPCPAFSNDIAAAWEVVEKLRWSMEDGVEFTIRRSYGSWVAGYCGRDGAFKLSALGESAPLAICEAALRTVGVEID